MDELLKKIEAFVQGPVAPRPAVAPQARPDHGQGDVKDPKHDMRLKQNRDKEHAEIAKGVVESEQNAGEDKSAEREEKHEEQDVKVPYERERVDHRAALTGIEMAVDKGLPMDHVPQYKQLPKLAPRMKSIAPKPPEMSPDLQNVLNHPVHGPYVHQLLGPNPESNQHLLPQVYEKMKNREMMGATAVEREEFQKFISLVAIAIVKTSK